MEYKRKQLLAGIGPFVDSDVIKVFVGMRRSGKTTVMKQFRDVLQSMGRSPGDIIYLDLESGAASGIRDSDSLYSYLIGRCNAEGRTYIFIDEIQNIDGWEKSIRAVMADRDCDIYLTGSNSRLLSGELATHIGGRYVEMDVLPFSFAEIADIIGGNDMSDLFGRYVEYGGMPLVVISHFGDPSAYSILSAIYDSVIINDIASRNGIRDIDSLGRILRYAVSEIGHPISAKNISDYLKSQRRKVSADTVIDYLRYAESSMLLRKITRYDIRGRDELKTDYKYYVSDLGIRQALGMSNSSSINQALENIVCLELIRRGYSVHVGKIGNKEIDFVAVRGKSREYYQVSYLLASEKTVEREFGSLLDIGDNYPKYVLSMDRIDMSRDGIIHLNIIDWLLRKSDSQLDVFQFSAEKG